MSHHLSGPNLRSPEGDARLDLTDLFAFAAPEPGRTVLIMNVNPIAPTGGEAFHPDAVYRINVDTDGDDRADIAFSFTFSEPAGGAQTMTVRRATGDGARDHEATGEQLAAGVPVSFGKEPTVVEAGPYRISAGLRSDPFFADLDGIVAKFQWTGVDWGADKNVFGIVLELPDTELGPDPRIGVWARVSVRKDGRLVSVDRGAHPSLTAYFNPEDAKDAYNAAEPADDWESYGKAWTGVLQHFGDYTTDAAEAQLRVVLPDILRYDRDRPAGYPNGRTLTDDVTSVRLTMLTDGKVPTDHIGPHTDLLPAFPYLGHPH
ncbi:DUF4331 family protein [Streptomyces rubellomurinus]|uniref:DUF4331 domain-containing protein n=1 Tax=Streptomyces rubellomurinus (strain ATCC 31215) TaxID=359131 RepID=A0A0F2TL60_STRR3|nr:DUF4331 family protein [Streptomyces rubellomurinus]KJS62447.1 hypothetical protein VM95_08630 [Streptomyces rubellomurinus]